MSAAAKYDHGQEEKIGVLLANLGTPSAPTAAALRRYLRQFLSDRRVVEAPRWLWWLVLRAAVLPFRPRRSAAAYAKIWTPRGSPLLVFCRRQSAALQAALAAAGLPAQVELGMSYGEPALAAALQKLEAANCRRLLVLPLYPQYAGSTTASVFDEIARLLQRRRLVPHFRFVSHYCDDPRYIEALAQSARAHWRQHGKPQALLFSFHGTPLSMLLQGDPYHCQCLKTARLLASALQLREGEWRVAFQSRFGRAPWLQPYTDDTLQKMARDEGIKNVQVVCPGFSADCLETLEEIAQENRDIFMQAGGEQYGYIPALNDDAAHIQLLQGIVEEAVADWLPAVARANQERAKQQSAYEALRAQPQYRP